MLSRSQRLTTKGLEEVMKKGRVYHSPFFVVRVYIGSDNKARCAAIAPQKIAKTSVARHSLRRRIYDSIQKIHPKIKEGFHIGLFAKAPAINATQEALDADILDVFVKADLIR